MKNFFLDVHESVYFEGEIVKVDEWLGFFKMHMTKKIFSLHDIVLLSGEKRSSVPVQLSRLVKSGIVERPVRGWYMNPFALPSQEELSMVIRRPSYLSLEYALSRQGILSQNVFTITLVTTKLPYSYRTGDTVLEYHQIKGSLFWGYSVQETVRVAEPEKAFLDLIYVRYVRGKNMERSSLASLIDDMYIDELNTEKLHQFAEGFDGRTKQIVRESLV